MNEAQTRLDKIDPKLRDAWTLRDWYLSRVSDI